jgi:hypothetical protein
MTYTHYRTTDHVVKYHGSISYHSSFRSFSIDWAVDWSLAGFSLVSFLVIPDNNKEREGDLCGEPIFFDRTQEN